MKILIHSINFSPDLTGIGKYTGEMADWLVEAGHEVRVVTAPPYYPQWRVADGCANTWTRSKERAGRMTVYRCPLWVPAKPGGVTRILHLASFALTSLPVVLSQVFWRPDVVLVIEPPFFCAPQAWLAARLSGARAWLHVQDFEIDAAFELGMLRSDRLRRIALAFERFWLRRFDRVSTISEKMLDKLLGKGGAPKRAVLFPNWVDPAEIYPMEQPSTFRQQQGLPSTGFVALYSGNMGEKQGLEVMLDAAGKLRYDDGIHFVLCGDGAARRRLQEKYADLPNVSWLPLQPASKLNALLNAADAHLLLQRSDAADLVMPSRLLGMLASGRPVLATADADTQLGGIVGQCGMLTPAGDVEAFVTALRKLAAAPEARTKMGSAGRLIVENRFSKGAVLAEFERELKEVSRA